MKTFGEVLKEQKSEVEELRSLAETINREKFIPNNEIIGVLLTGSIARGDARITPPGLLIDLSILVNKRGDISLDDLFGEDEEPGIPYHCVTVKENVKVAIEIIEESDIWKIREKTEPEIFAKNESIILNDKMGILKIWKNQYFIITDEQARQRALKNYFRFRYLTEDYRFEKWKYRKAYIQILQNFNEAGECYCSFLFCINKKFIPRKDWLTYLTYELNIKPGDHESFMKILYTSIIEEEFVLEKKELLHEIENWMKGYCREKKWL